MEKNQKPITVLLTDCNSRVRDLLRRELEWEGYEVSCAKNEKEAIERVTAPSHVDVAIIDPGCFLPRGPAMFQNIIEALGDVPVIIHSFKDQWQDIGSNRQAVCFVDKNDCNINKLKEAINSCAAHRKTSDPGCESDAPRT